MKVYNEIENDDLYNDNFVLGAMTLLITKGHLLICDW